MIQIKKILSMSMVAMLVTASSLTGVTAKAATVATPKVYTVVTEHSPLVAGDTETFTVNSSKSTGNVQYRAFMEVSTGNWDEITSGYTAAAGSKVAVTLPKTKAITLGKHRVSIWVKTAGKTGINSNTNGDYDSFRVVPLEAVKAGSRAVNTSGAANFTQSGLTINFNGITNIAGDPGSVVYQLFYMNTATGAWGSQTAKPYAATQTLTFPAAGNYVAFVHAKTIGSTRDFEGYKAFNVTATANAATTKVFDTTVTPASFGSVVNVALTTDGVKNFATATQYKVFNGTEAISKMATLGANTTVYPTKAAGDNVTVKLYNASSVEVKSIDVALGQSGTIPVVVVVPPTESVTTATVKAASFGSLITATSTQLGAVQYQVFNATDAVSKKVNLGTATTVFPAKSIGDTVTIKLFDAAGTTVVGTSTVVLTAAK